MSLVPNIWKKSEKPSNAVAEVEFVDNENDAYAMVIAERISIPLEALKNAAVQNMRAVDNEAAIVKEEKRVVNGKPVLAMIMNVKTQGAAFTFYSYYYTGDEGSFQVVTWTGQNLFKELQPELEEFLNGLRDRQEVRPTARRRCRFRQGRGLLESVVALNGRRRR